jgi:hypothetical protein
MNAVATPGVSIEALEDGTLDVEQFDHEAHVYVAWLYLQQYPLHEAAARFIAALKRLTALLGIPGKYHETISWFFMLLIAERRNSQKSDDWHSFYRNHADLFARGDANILNRYYSSELLGSDRARRSFMLPDKLAPKK